MLPLVDPFFHRPFRTTFTPAPTSDRHRRDLLELCEDRYATRSTLLTSQLPVKLWHAAIGDPTLADAILDRLVHNAQRLELKGPSRRKARAPGVPVRHRYAVTHSLETNHPAENLTRTPRRLPLPTS